MMNVAKSNRLSRLLAAAVAEEVLKARTEGARLADSQFEQGAALASVRAEAAAKMDSAKASLLEEIWDYRWHYRN